MSRDDPLGDLLEAHGVVLLDGGLATTLADRGADLSGELWSARLLADDPDAIREAHAAFLTAGADVVITASYQATVEGFARRGIAPADARALLRRSVELARAARRRTGRAHALVAASVGPYGAALADGSEYRGYEGLGVATLRRFHRERLEILGGAGADLLAIETLPAADEAEALLDLLGEVATPPAWMTFTARDDGHLSDGSPIGPVAASAAAHPRIVGVGVNCTPPERISGLLDELPPSGEVHRVVYPNLGDRWDPTDGGWAPREGIPAELVRAWRERGVEVVGGCCGTSPEHIAALGRTLRDGQGR